MNEEHPIDRERRRLSHYVVYFTITSSSLFYSALLVSLWPYLNRLDGEADKTFLGYLAAAGAIATTLFCPLFGRWSNTLKSCRMPFLLTLVCGGINYMVYVCLPLIAEGNRRYWFLFARFMTGMNDVNIGLSRGYIAESTLKSERRQAIAILSGCQTIAFACGPALQSLLVPLGEDGYWLIPNIIKLDMYTGIGWLGLLTTLANIVLFRPASFKHCDMRNADDLVGGTGSSQPLNRHYKLLAWLFILLQFVLVCNYLFLKILGTPLVMDEYAMTRKDALAYNSYVVALGAVVSLIAIFVMDACCRWTGETRVMLAGFVIMIIARFIMYPIGGAGEMVIASNSSELGCPQWTQAWCIEERPMRKWQFVTSNLLDNFGYSWAITLIYTRFSQVLGAKQQGTWMGFMTSLSGLARIVSPLVLGYIYMRVGNADMVLLSNFLYIGFVFSILWLIYYYTRRGGSVTVGVNNVHVVEESTDMMREMREIKQRDNRM